MVPGGSRDSEPPPTKDIPRMSIQYEEVFSLLLPQREKGYRASRKRMKTKYYELEACYERKCEETRVNGGSMSSRELDLMSGTLHSQREILAAHKWEHYSECSQLISNGATEFDDFIMEYHTSQFKFNLDDSRDLQHVCRDAYLGLHDCSIDPETLSEAFWTLVESWDSTRVAIFANGQTHSDINQPPSTIDEPQPAAAVKVLEEVHGTSESSVNDSLTPSAQTRCHPGLSPALESRNVPERVQTTRSQVLPELEGSAPSTLPETPKERVTERSMSILGLADAQVQTSSFSAELGEERRVYNSVVSIHAKDEEQHTPDSVSTAFVLLDSVPSSSPIPNTHATSKSCPSTPSRKHDSPRVQQEVRRTRDSTSESRNAPERVQTARSQARPSPSKPDSVSPPRELHRKPWSSLTKDDEPFKARNVDSRRETATTVSHSSSKPECLSVPWELQRNARSSLKDNELSKARKTDFHRKSPSKSPMETVTTVSRTLSKSPTYVESRRLSEPVQKLPVKDKPKGVLHGSPRSRAITATTSCAPSSRATSYSHPRMGNAIVSTKEQVDTSKHAPSTKTALTLSNLSPVSSIRARPSNRLTNEPKPSLSNVSKWRMPNVVNTKQMVKMETHQRIDAHSRASLPNANPRFGKIPSSPNTGESEQPKRAANSLGSPSGLPEIIPECSEEHSILFGQLASVQVNSLSLSGEMGEKQRTLDTVISIQKENNKNNLPEATAALTLPAPALDTSPIHPGPLRHSLLEGIRLQVIEKAIQKVSTPETRNMLERVQMTRSEASPSSMESDNHPEPPGLNTSPPNITHEPMSARTPIFAKSVLEMVSPISRPSLNLGIKPSNRTVLTPFPKCRDVKKQSIGKAEVSLTKGTNSAKRLPAPRMVSLPSKPSPVVISLTRASSFCPSKDKAVPPFPVVPKRRASSVVSTNHVINNNITNRLLETLSRVSNGSPLLPYGEKPFSPVAGEAKQAVEPKGELSRSPKSHERSAERSARFQRLVSERVPIPLLLDKIGEKRRIYDTVVNIQINKSEDNAPEATTTSALPFSTPLPSFIHPTPTASAPPPSDEPSPPVEVVTRRRILNVVNKKSSASELPHSPYLGTARRQSQPSRNEGEQLASAVAYIRERISRRSLACNESVRCSPAVPPDKIGDPKSDSRRLETRVVNKEKETSVTIRSPVSEGSESSLVRPDAIPQQLKARRAEELSSEH